MESTLPRSSEPTTERENARLRAQVRALEEALHSAHALLRIAPAYFGFVSLRGAVLDLNDLSLEVIGARKEDIVGSFFWDAPWWKSLPESSRNVRIAVERAAQGEPSQFDVEYRAQSPATGDATRWVTMGITPERDERGDVFRIAVTGIDITARRLARSELQRSESRYREAKEQLHLALQSAHMGTWHLDLVTMRAQLSEGTWRIFGREDSPEDVFALVDRVVHPDDRQELNRLWQHSVDTRSPFWHEYRIVRPDGSIRWIFARGTTKVGTDGRALHFSGVIGDITERKEAEMALLAERHKLETIFRESPAAMALWSGSDHVFEKVNPRFQAIFRCRELLGRTFVEALPDMDEQGFYEQIAHVFETGEAYTGHEVLARVSKCRGGPQEERYYDFTYVRVDDPDGKPYGVYDHAIDVTDRVLARRDLEESKVRLQATVRELEQERETRDRFVTSLSHDLRAPLTAAKISAQMLERKTPDLPELNRLAGRIADNMDRADAMLRDLLDASRIKAGERIALEVVDCDLTYLVRATVDELASIHGDRFLLEAKEGVHGKWDADVLRRILENLAGNALKYGSELEPITIRLYEDDEVVELAVHNKGNPIAPEERDTLFEPYRRAEAATKSSQRGWGIGLTLVRGFAEAHEGKAFVRSSAEEGTTFAIQLPRRSPGTVGLGATS